MPTVQQIFSNYVKNMYYHSSHISCHFVRKPKSTLKVCLVRWPALLETRASRLPTTHYACQPIAIGWQAACRLHIPQGSHSNGRLEFQDFFGTFQHQKCVAGTGNKPFTFIIISTSDVISSCIIAIACTTRLIIISKQIYLVGELSY